MIAELTFIDELKGIKKSLGVGTDNATFKLIDTIGREGSRRALIGFIHPAATGGVLIHFVQREGLINA